MLIFELAEPEERITDQEVSTANKFFTGSRWKPRKLQTWEMVRRFKKLGWTPFGKGLFILVIRDIKIFYEIMFDVLWDSA